MDPPMDSKYKAAVAKLVMGVMESNRDARHWFQQNLGGNLNNAGFEKFVELEDLFFNCLIKKSFEIIING
jgi:hypothetical protein